MTPAVLHLFSGLGGGPLGFAHECKATLESSRAGRLHLSGQPVWVEEEHHV